MNVLYIVAVVIAILAVAAVLLMGLLNMARGGSGERSQSLMRWRVGLQFLAVGVIIVVAWALGTG